MNSNTENEYLIFAETSVTKVEQKTFPLDYLVDELKKYSRILENLTPSELGVLLPIVLTESEFSIALALHCNTIQGSLLYGNGIEESARKALIEKIKAAEEKSVSSIKAGNKIARKLKDKKLSLEDLHTELEDVSDEDITRHVINLGRYPTTAIDFTNSSENVGGNFKIPSHLNSAQKIKFSNCIVKESLGGGEFEIYTPDSYKTNDNSMIKKKMIRVHCEKASVNFVLIQLAHLFQFTFEFEASIEEQIRDKKKKIMITKIDSDKILSETESHLSEIKENLSFEF